MKQNTTKKANVASKPFIVEGIDKINKIIKEVPSSNKRQLQKQNPIGVVVEKQNQKSLSGSKFNLDSQKKASSGRFRTNNNSIDSKNPIIDWWRSDYKELSMNLGEKHWYDELSDLLPTAVSENMESLSVNSDMLAGSIYSV